jgi:hypothetical protein
MQLILVIGAAFYLGRSIYKSTRGHACETGNCGCDKPVFKQKG